MAIQNAINLIKTACTQWNLGYDQSNRLDFRKGGETDCSALVILTCEQAGLLPRNNIRKGIGATYTGNMRANFQARGWRVLRNLSVSQLQPGDVLLNDADHTAMYVGNGQIAQASIDEHGRASGGASGDQTGRETLVRSYYNFPWSCVLRFHGTALPATPGVHTREYIVEAGDTLSSIASKLLGDGNKWHDIYNANKGTIGPNPAKIKAGMKLVIP
jgi:cell wall-associated NlpC family hydrolase